jgi:hypothetical protein
VDAVIQAAREKTWCFRCLFTTSDTASTSQSNVSAALVTTMLRSLLKELYGQERLLASVREHARRPAPELIGELLADVHRFVQSEAIADHVCLVGMEVVRLD